MTMKTKPKIKLDIKIDVYENGSGVVIKNQKTRKVIGGRVFLNEQKDDMKKFIEEMKIKAENE
jgi:hypothetical protein